MPANAELIADEPSALDRAPPPPSGRSHAWAWRHACQHLALWVQIARNLDPVSGPLPIALIDDGHGVGTNPVLGYCSKFVPCDSFSPTELGCRGRWMSDMVERWAEDNEQLLELLLPARAKRRIRGVERNPASQHRPRRRDVHHRRGPTFGVQTCVHIGEAFRRRHVDPSHEVFLMARVRTGKVVAGFVGAPGSFPLGLVGCTENSDGRLGCQAEVCNRGPKWLTRNGMLQRHYQDVLLQRRADGRLLSPGGGGPQGGNSR